jgi:hypothetical protein
VFEDHPNILKDVFPWNDPQSHSFSGIPPHSALLNDLKALRIGLEQMMEPLTEKIKSALEDTRVENGGVLSEKKLLEYLDSFKVDMMEKFAAVERGQNINDINVHDNNDNLDIVVTEQPERERVYNVHTFSGRLQRVPDSFQIPKCGVFHLWRQWWIGNDVTHIPPLRLLVTKDIDFLDRLPLTDIEKIGRRGGSTKRRPVGKTLSDIRYLMNVLLKMVEEEGALQNRITIRSVDEMFKAIERRLLIRVRDIQKNWRSVVRELRENKVQINDHD